MAGEADLPQIDPMMMDLFKVELETQTTVLSAGILRMEEEEGRYMEFEALMRAAHSIKGAGRIVRMEPLIQLAHSMEDAFVAAQKGLIAIGQQHIDALLYATDLLISLSKQPSSLMQLWLRQQESEWHEASRKIQTTLKEENVSPHEIASLPSPVLLKEGISATERRLPAIAEGRSPTEHHQQLAEDRILRVTAENLNRLMDLAGEALVESRWLEPFADSILKTKNLCSRAVEFLELLKYELEKTVPSENAAYNLAEALRLASDCRSLLTDRQTDLDQFVIRNSVLSAKLYDEVVDSRMRPFGDCLEEFPRMVRDLAKKLNKKVHFEILGRNTLVDRDILDKLESPLGHLLRNAVDHGIESPEERIALGKSPEGKIVLEAQHKGGMLLITIADDGRGIDLERLRQSIIDRKLMNKEMVDNLLETELLDFLLLPGFSTAKQITDISGRGVGLNIVQNIAQELSGTLHINQEPGKGTMFSLQLPLTLSVIRTLIVKIAGDPYALPLARIQRVTEVQADEVKTIEGRCYFSSEGENIGLVSAAQVLELDEEKTERQAFPVVVFNDRHNSYGIIVDQFVEQRELVIHELDPRLKKIPDVHAAALMEDGSPLIILDLEDIVRSIDRLFIGGKEKVAGSSLEPMAAKEKKRILVIDDSVTVREVEARLLRNQGYEVEIGVNGMDGWHAVRIGNYDLVITDIDMPRMNGLELIRAIRSDSRLKNLPVLIVSYKEREEDRRLGLEAGANAYLTKSGFQDEALIEVVCDLIGK